MTPRPALTGIQRYALRFNHIAAMEGTEVVPEMNGDYVRYGDHLTALAALASQEQRRIDRHDEAIRLLRKWLKSGQYPVTETKAFLAEEPK